MPHGSITQFADGKFQQFAPTIEEVPADGSPCGDLLVVPEEVDLGPEVAVESVDGLAAEVGGAGEPVGRQETHGEQDGAAGRRVEVEGGAVGPLHVVRRVAGELVADQVQVASARPVVVEVDELQPPAALGEVGEHHRVELLRPRRRSGGRVADGGRRRGPGMGCRDGGEEEREQQKLRRRRRHWRFFLLIRAYRLVLGSFA